MPFPWSEDTEVPQDGAKSGDSWGCAWILLIPLLGLILGKVLTIVI